MRVLLTGGSGMVGQAVLRRAKELNTGWTIDAPSSRDLDQRDAAKVAQWFATHKYDLVIHAAAKVGGIKANMADPAGFLFENMMIGLNVIQAAHNAGINNLIFLGSSCMYPKDYNEVLKEEHMLAAKLEPTNEGYALAKISAAKQCEYISRQYGRNYRTVIPCNLYGEGDHFDPARGHLLAAAILKVDGAMKAGSDKVEIWGDGMARREFMYVDDLADFIVRFGGDAAQLPHYINVGYGSDYTVNEYYDAVAKALGYKGGFTHKLDAPVGMMRKLTDSGKAHALGWKATTPLEEGIRRAYACYNHSLKEAA